MQRGKVAFHLKQKSGKRIGISGNVFKFVILQIEYLAEVGNQGLAFKYICMVLNRLTIS